MDRSRVSLGKLPSAAQCLHFLTWNKGGVLTFLSCLANALDSDLLFAIKSWVLKQSTRHVFGPTTCTPWSKGQSITIPGDVAQILDLGQPGEADSSWDSSSL